MQNSATHSAHSSAGIPHSFSHIYVERRALDYPDTHTVLERFPGAQRIEIDHYKDVFNRPGQRFQVQKHAPKLILAVEQDGFLYEGSERIKSFGDDVIYYNSLVRNCVYNCDYCFLQGMHQSGNIVMFMNNEDFMEAAAELGRKKPFYLSISYLTDLPAFEYILPYCERWIRFAQEHPEITIELRTKSDNFPAIRHLTPPENVVLVWSLSPEAIARSYEKGTASFKNRLFAARNAQRAGWRTRLCFDPVLRVPDWQRLYREAIEETFRRLDPEGIESLSFGVFRLHPDFLKRIRKQRQDADILYYPFEAADGVASYPPQELEEMREFLERTFAEYLPKEALSFVHG